MHTIELIVSIVAVGTGATALLDLWLLALARLGVPSAGFAPIGRWVGHMPSGRFVHAAGIATSAPVAGELALGWLTHYAVGVAYAGLLVACLGEAWLRQPALLPAAVFGLATVAAPWFVMQPAMGAGMAASRTPAPWKNRLRSLANHAVFGFGLYAAALPSTLLSHQEFVR